MHALGLRRNEGKTQGAARQAGGPALTALRAATHAAHAALETSLPLLSPTLCFAGYARHLQAIAPLVEALEDHIGQATARLAALGFDYASRRRHRLLRADLQALGERQAAWAHAAPLEGSTAAALAQHNSFAARLGLLYVLEGSTLGGQMLRRHLSRQLRARPRELQYLSGHGRRTGLLWRHSCALLEQALSTPADVASACGAATDAFSWFRAHSASQ